MNRPWSAAAGALEELQALLDRTREGSVAIVVAHADDETIGAGLALMRLADARVIHVTDSAPHNPRLRSWRFQSTRQAYAVCRRQEMLAALAVAGVPPDRQISLEAPDQESVFRLADLTEKLEGILATWKPAVVVTHAVEGGHPDHDAAAFVCRAARARLRARGIEFPLAEMPLYRASPDGRLEVQTFARSSAELVIVPEPAEVERKRKMIDQYASQREVLSWFPVSVERFREGEPWAWIDPDREKPYYERMGWMSAAAWRARAEEALGLLGLRDAELS